MFENTWSLLAAGVAFVAFVYIFFIHFKPRDWRYLYKGIKVLMEVKRGARTNALTSDMWYERLQISPLNRVCMVFEGREYTLGDFEKSSNQVARWALAKGFQKDDCLALNMTNCPEYVMVWQGITKIGGITSLINYNLVEESLIHSLKVCSARALVFGADLAQNVRDILPALKQMVADSGSGKGSPVELFCYYRSQDEARKNSENYATPFDLEIAKQSTEPVPENSTAKARGTKYGEAFLYVYTSGTTGLPKAGIISHFRFRSISAGVPAFYGVVSSDRVYCALPLYHSAAGLIGVGMMFRAGATIILSKKFSKSHFWSDVRKYDATVIQYIGELCRYLLTVPPDPSVDAKNNVRVAIGNGLRPEIWREFQTRFGIKQIAEFYGATEGASILLNTENKEGAVGFLSPAAAAWAPLAIVRFDIDREEPLRDKNGFCMKCSANEPGEFIAAIKEFAKGVTNFSGYKNQESNNKKILRDVFKKGDMWFRSGDLLRMDDEGFVYFHDRIGDTFRWKGENVATGEVARILAMFSPATREPNVYGVQIPNYDGRAGMVSFASPDGKLQPSDFDWDGLAHHVTRNLPAYARPLFVRILSTAMEITGTFKHKKSVLVTEGFNPNTVTDPLFFFNGAKFEKLTSKVYERIMSGDLRL